MSWTATGQDLVRALTSAPGPIARPVVAVLPAQAARVGLLPSAGRGGVPAYSDAEDAARAMSHAAAQYAYKCPLSESFARSRARTAGGIMSAPG